MVLFLVFRIVILLGVVVCYVMVDNGIDDGGDDYRGFVEGLWEEVMLVF